MVDTIKFSQMTPGGDLAPGDFTPGLLAGANVLFSNPWTFLAPGSTAARPVPSVAIDGRLRFNTDTLVYEYYDTLSSTWVELSGSGTGTVNPGATNDLSFYASAGTILSPILAAANSVLVTNGSSLPSLSTTLPSGLSIPGATITASTAALTAGSVVAAPVAGTDLVNKTYADGLYTASVHSITGTTNQIIASSPTGDVALSLPQDIATGSTPTFNNMILSGLTAHGILIGEGGTPLTSIVLGAGQILIGTTSGDPLAAAINSGQNILVGNSSGAITIGFTGNLPVTNLNSGTSAGSTTFWRGDGTWAVPAGTGVTSVSGTLNRITSTGGTTPVIDIAATYVGQTSITTLGTVATGVWQGTLISPIFGGTGVNNGASTLTLGGSLTTSGAFASTFTMTGATNVTFPTSGTLATIGATVSSITGTANQIAASASAGAVTLSLVSNPILPGTGGVTLPSGNTAARAGGAGTMRFNSQTSVFEATVDGSTWATIETSTIGVVSITGTANQVIASAATGAVTLSLPQSIGTGNSPTFAGLTLTNPYIAGAGGLHSFQIFTSGSAATYTKPTNVTSILIELIGGGGGGGGAAAAAASQGCAGGGGAGGYARLYVASAASTYTYTVGAGGAGGLTTPATGTAGGTTTFSASSLQATGGTGGSVGSTVAVTVNASVADAAGGIGTNGNENVAGGAGIGGIYLTSGGRSGKGGDSVYGGGGVGNTTNAVGVAGGNYGAGGGGAFASASNSNVGGTGSGGIIIIWEFA